MKDSAKRAWHDYLQVMTFLHAWVVATAGPLALVFMWTVYIYLFRSGEAAGEPRNFWIIPWEVAIGVWVVSCTVGWIYWSINCFAAARRNQALQRKRPVRQRRNKRRAG